MKMTKMMAGVLAVTAPAAFADVADSTFSTTGLGVDVGAIAASAPLGIAVCTNVRNAMQALAMPEDSVCDPANTAGHAVFGDSKTCMPSISTSELNAIASGAQSSTNSVTGPNASSGGAFTLGAHLDQDFGYNGTAANLSWSKQATTQGADDAVSGYGNLAGCVAAGAWNGTKAADVATAVSNIDTICANSGKTARSAISILPVNVSGDNFRFIKLDGVAPTLAEHLEGDYNLLLNAIGTVTTAPTFTQPFGTTGGALWSGAAGDAPAKAIGAAGDFCFQPRAVDTVL